MHNRPRRHFCSYLASRFVAANLVLPGWAAAQEGELAATHPDAPWPLPLSLLEAELRRELVDPTVLEGPAYAALRAELQTLIDGGAKRKAFVKAFNAAWRKGPISHVHLQHSPAAAAELAERLDHMDAGPQAVQLRWQGDVAVLEVKTFMGRDTEAAIGAAYREIMARSARTLVIDLRRNEGGAFAVAPLVGHLLDRAHDSGVFMSRRGRSAGAPSRAVADGLPPWRGGSLLHFWAEVQAAPYTRVRFEPLAPHYAGPVFLLTSARTASAAELATDALLGAGRVQVWGERTAGRMLSQKPFDLPHQLLLFVPVADYHAWHSGRIEGHGVTPSRNLPADQALEAVLAQAAGGSG